MSQRGVRRGRRESEGESPALKRSRCDTPPSVPGADMASGSPRPVRFGGATLFVGGFLGVFATLRRALGRAEDAESPSASDEPAVAGLEELGAEEQTGGV